MSNITASYQYSGLPDYWYGAGGRGERGGCAFAYYGRNTTLHDLVDQWVDDAWQNEHDFAGCPEEVSSDDIREAIVDSFTEAGRADYASHAICEFSLDIEDERVCRECEEPIGDLHDEDCAYVIEQGMYEVEDDDCEDDNDMMESPIAIMWIDWSDHPDYVEV